MMRDDEFESRVLRFEQARRLPGPCEIADYLEGPASTDAPCRARLLVELICIDLEYGWRTPGPRVPPTLQGYVERFPELRSLDALPIDLVGEEYRVRCRWGDRPSHDAFLSRFADRRDPIRAELLRIDAEIESEAAGPRSYRDSWSPSPAGDVGTESAIGLLSHRDFLLRRMIGAGRMGKVFEASRRDGGRPVAVKFLRRSFLDHPGVVGRFLGEARTVAGLRHPHIVGTEGLGRTPGGSYFLVMNLVAGPSLATLAERRTIAVDEAIRWALELCDAIAHAHDLGVAHCDLKPANILLDEGGRIRVADFGLARSLAGETPWSAEVEGTAPFMAPEQASRCWGPIDHRTDVYGIGAVMFTLLTGRPPFVGRRIPDVLAQVVAATEVVSPAFLRPDIPGTVDAVCLKCLAKPPVSRFQAVREIRRALESA